MNKYVIRRAVAGIIITPLVAFCWVVFYALMVGAGAGASSSVGEVWTNGLWLGVIGSVVFAGSVWGKA